MKIRAIRLREVGLFRAPVAIEGFSGTLDVLAGPNELGKSTLLRALDRLFFLQPSSKHKDIELLRPTSGGAPLIEADFEAAGRTWRLRKQFLTGRGAAELTDLATEQVKERGPDAHARALELIGAPADGQKGPAGLLWVTQPDFSDPRKDARRPTDLASDQRDLLLSAIETEVAEVADGGTLREMRQRIEEELAPLVTGKTGKPRGDYKTVLDAVEHLNAELSAARAQAALVEQRSAELERRRAEHAALTDPATRAAASEALAAAQVAVENGRRAREQWRLAVSTRQKLESEQKRLAAEHRNLREQFAESSDLAAKLAVLTQQMSAAAADAKTSTAHAEAAQARQSETQALLMQAQDQVRARTRLDELDAHRRRLSEARSAAADEQRLAAEIAGIGVTDALVRKAEAEQTAIDKLQADLMAAAPRVNIEYVPGVREGISTDGRPLTNGTVLHPTQPLTLDIAGIGRITISPQATFDLAETHADLDAHAQELRAVLTAMRVDDLATARAQLARRRDLAAEHAAATSRLRAVARDGLPQLEHLVAQGEAALSLAPDTVTLPSREALSAQVEALEQAAHAALANGANAGRAAQIHAQTLVALQARHEATSARASALANVLTEIADPAARVAEIETQLIQATSALNTAARDVIALQETAPNDAAWAALQADAERHQQQRARSEATLTVVTEAIARLEGELAGRGDDDLTQRIEVLAGELARAQTRTHHFGQEVAALSLLARLIDEAQVESQDRFLEPVLARIEPYLRAVLPQARLHLSKDLSPAGLIRGNNGAGPESFTTLSGGTQEQLAVLTRLGFGRLLAERGQAAPVILDDALVYSDDQRIESLFGVLRAASEHHQVIVLTCRSRVFESLGGTRLKIAPWRVD